MGGSRSIFSPAGEKSGNIRGSLSSLLTRTLFMGGAHGVDNLYGMGQMPMLLSSRHVDGSMRASSVGRRIADVWGG
jgi:hypothetical protein